MTAYHFQMPHLQKDGTLAQVDALAIYRHYLGTEKLDFDQQMRRPCRSNILKAMCGLHAKHARDATQFVMKHMASGGRVLFWSDQHFYHHNIIRYSERPFDNVEHMNNEMLSRYYQTVTDNDLVIFGGDIAFGEVEKGRTLLANLPGKKILVLGNHDFDKNKLVYRDYHIFDEITMVFVFYLTHGKEIINVLVTHYPVDNKWLPDNTINVHGHIHKYLADHKNINMAVEHTNYQPVDLTAQIINTFNEYC